MNINFECKKCGNIFNSDIGDVSISEDTFRPIFEKDIICTKCGKCSIDDVLLTELGQTQLTQATLDYDFEELFDAETDDLNGLESHEGECQGCDIFKPLNDLGLCDDCAEKLDRDMIRQRDWDYSTLAFGLPETEREVLRKKIIQKYGEKLELIAPQKRTAKRPKKKKRRKKKSGKRR